MTRPEAPALAEKHFVSGNIFRDTKLMQELPSLPRSCVESARILRERRELYEREGVFPPSVVHYTAAMLEAEHDEDMNARLSDLPADDCPAVDDLDHQLGDPGEASLAEALSFAATGSCSSRRAAAASALSRRHAEIGKPSHRLDAWRQLIGAY